jgi:lysophospholipid acyltransferase (LPLAT)-like uncharacterized protein
MTLSSTPERSSRPTKLNGGGVVVPHAPKWYQRAGASAIFGLARVVSATLRITWDDRSTFFDAGPAKPAIYCVWHNRLALCMTVYFGFVRPRTSTLGLAALVSASKDGGFLAAILERFGVQPVRGSSSRRGAQALLELTSWADRGYNLAITPDGPRGPRYQVQPGAISLAQVTGLPIVPVSYSLGAKIRLKSWDQFQIPLPFSRCTMVFEKPIWVERGASDEEREQLRLELEHRLRGITIDDPA